MKISALFSALALFIGCSFGQAMAASKWYCFSGDIGGTPAAVNLLASPFGLVSNGDDKTNNGSPKQSVYELHGRLAYENSSFIFPVTGTAIAVDGGEITVSFLADNTTFDCNFDLGNDQLVCNGGSATLIEVDPLTTSLCTIIP